MFDVADYAYIDTGSNRDTFWTVPTGALPPISVVNYGRAPFGSTTSGLNGLRFNDSTGVTSTARKAIIFCSAQTSADKHCDAGGPGLFAVGSTVNMIELFARNAKQVEVSKKIALFKLQ